MPGPVEPNDQRGAIVAETSDGDVQVYGPDGEQIEAETPEAARVIGGLSGRRIILPAPLPHQVPVLLHPARNKVLTAGRRWGKTLTGLICVIEGHGAHRGQHIGALQGGNIWWVTTTHGVAKAIWRDLKAALREGWVSKSEVDKRIVLPGGGAITVKSADNPDSLRGEGLDGVVIDEAAHCSRDAWEQGVRPALVDRQGWAFFISSPKGRNWFWQLYEQAGRLPNWARWQRPSADNPTFPQSEVDKAQQESPPKIFRQEYLAQFEAPGGALCQQSWFQYFTIENPAGAAKTTQQARDVVKALGANQGEPEALGVTFVCVKTDGSIKRIPRNTCRVFQTVDLAASVKASADYTVVSTWAATPDLDLLLLDRVRGRFEGPDQPALITGAWAKWSPAMIAIEQVGYQLALIQAMVRQGLPIMAVRPDADKVSRFIPFCTRMKAGAVYWPAGMPWLHDWEDELVSFPDGEHDDQVDTASLSVCREVLGAARKFTVRRS